MHNGLLVEAGGYYGDWMAEIIRVLRGHHEPQEEAVFDRIVRHRAAEGGPAVMIEFGSFWTYYALWFCRSIPSARAIAVEPDPAYLEVGRRNAVLNDLSTAVTFLHAAIGDRPGQTMSFCAESDGQEHTVEQCDLGSVMRTGDVEHVDLVLADVQGAETILLERAKDILAAGRVRFLVLSTHHHSISRDALTHQRALEVLNRLGAHVICEHTVGESFSGDGLIAVSFDERDRDLVVEVSRARSRDSLFGELEYALAAADSQRLETQQSVENIRLELQRAQAELRDCTEDARSVRSRLDVAERRLVDVNHEVDDLSHRLHAIYGSKLWRWTQLPREEYSRLRRLRARVRP
jgi:FkbM family methyltransferase